ncbi:uncharacterized protein BX664DRAFT_339566 [Halteromyces radiatus]|uniref:uncharacterized protein n=1 Tax=Halteromyces radiatus TaxID=101107 RepID=UPI00221E5061|nr:uncharacterized protein BX664DRAFT_339566 [Halteromyces radiatus]KAI8082990.1 hypothetical protein BX664DRAFT_339566 [Halteromyces radiatus]
MEWNDYRNQPRYNSTKSYLSSTAKGDRRNNSTQQDQNTFRNGDDQLVVAPSKATTSNTKGDDLCKSMEALSTKDESSTIDDNTSILECMGKSIKMVTLQDMFEKYEYMRGGCNLQLIDETKALVVFGHPSTAKRAWEENKDNGVISIQGYQGPMDIVKDPTPVRKSMINQRTRPSNPAAQRFIHGALGLKSPARKIERQ